MKKKKKKDTDKVKDKGVDEIISEVRNLSDQDSDSEEADFWMPPVGERWDLDDGGDRWGSGSESGQESEEVNGTGMFSCVSNSMCSLGIYGSFAYHVKIVLKRKSITRRMSSNLFIEEWGLRKKKKRYSKEAMIKRSL